ncbi:MAG: 2-hydroxyglutaryl-CoA dehydratase [bacterium]|nr:2-hydroxyglutaryl-CoA dehydratase [bacterium]
MITAGCDIGSLTAKAVILKDGKILSSPVIKRKQHPDEAALEVIGLALDQAGMYMNDIDYCVGTGYGCDFIPFANGTESEISCHGKGAVWQRPSARMVIDIGGQDAKAIKVGEDGSVRRYIYNDKCASGTGRFLEIIAEALDTRLEDMGDLALSSTNNLTLSNQCVVFAETEIISLVNEGKEIADILNALHNAVANRIVSLARSIEPEEEIVMTGGVAKNPGMFSALGKALGMDLVKMKSPQINGALGAALFAMEQVLVS